MCVVRIASIEKLNVNQFAKLFYMYSYAVFMSIFERLLKLAVYRKCIKSFLLNRVGAFLAEFLGNLVEASCSSCEEAQNRL